MKNDHIELIPPDLSLAEPLCAYYLRNRDFLRPFEPVREEDFYTPEYQKIILQTEISARKNGTGCRFYICPVEEPGKIIGIIGLNNIIRGAFQSCHLGYKLDEAYVGRGYMTMAVSMIVDHAFQELHLHRIEANVMPRNAASLRVLEKCGFENEGLSKYYLNINGIWEDHIHMVKLNYEMHKNHVPGEGTQMIKSKHIVLAYACLLLFAIALAVGFLKWAFFIPAAIFLSAYLVIDKKYLRCPYCSAFTNLDKLSYAKSHIYHCHNCGKRIEIQ